MKEDAELAIEWAEIRNNPVAYYQKHGSLSPVRKSENGNGTNTGTNNADNGNANSPIDLLQSPEDLSYNFRQSCTSESQLRAQREFFAEMCMRKEAIQAEEAIQNIVFSPSSRAKNDNSRSPSPTQNVKTSFSALNLDTMKLRNIDLELGSSKNRGRTMKGQPAAAQHRFFSPPAAYSNLKTEPPNLLGTGAFDPFAVKFQFGKNPNNSILGQKFNDLKKSAASPCDNDALINDFKKISVRRRTG